MRTHESKTKLSSDEVFNVTRAELEYDEDLHRAYLKTRNITVRHNEVLMATLKDRNRKLIEIANEFDVTKQWVSNILTAYFVWLKKHQSSHQHVG